MIIQIYKKMTMKKMINKIINKNYTKRKINIKRFNLMNFFKSRFTKTLSNKTHSLLCYIWGMGFLLLEWKTNLINMRFKIFLYTIKFYISLTSQDIFYTQRKQYNNNNRCNQINWTKDHIAWRSMYF